jgi:serine O-acetyltransferase
MKLSLNKNDLQSYISAQLNTFFPDNNLINLNEYNGLVDVALDRLDFCFNKSSFERYNDKGDTILNHLYADQYLVFLWFLANTIYKEKGHNSISTKLYYLNKSLHAFDCMYDTGLPDIFLIFHGAGTMLGKATYENYFVALQGCTVGSHKGKYPAIGKGVALAAHASIIGDCKIEDRVSISLYTSVFEKNVPSNTVVYTDSDNGKVSMKTSTTPYAQQFFNVDLGSL